MSSSPWAGVSRYQILKQRRTISHIKVTTIGKRRLLGRWFKFYLYLHSLNGQTNNGIYSNIRPEERLTTTRACANQQEGGRSKDISWPEPDIALYHLTTRRLGLEAWLSIPFRSGSPFISYLSVNNIFIFFLLFYVIGIRYLPLQWASREREVSLVDPGFFRRSHLCPTRRGGGSLSLLSLSLTRAT